MAYASWSVVFGEQPSAAKWNILGTNDASFNDGTGIGNATISASKLATGATQATVATSETTTSTSYVALATAGPAVTVTIGANGLALVAIGAQMGNSNANNPAHMAFAISGASTVASNDQTGIFYIPYGASASGKHGETYLITGLTAGSNTFTAQYKCGIGGTSQFTNRRITVVPL